MLPIEI
jgi:hypothetical protein